MEYRHPRAANCTGKDGQIISRHRTSEGVVVYAYCDTGGLHMWVTPHDLKVRPRADAAA